MNERTIEALQRAERLGTLGIEVRSIELAEEAKRVIEFAQNGGNRAMRRAAAKRAGAARTPRVGGAKVR